MRLAGCYHLSAKGASPSLIVSESGTRYGFKDLRRIIPKQQKTPPPSLPQLQPLSTIGDVPLIECLPIADRELVTGGAGEGGRNTLGYKLACSLIGAEQRLQYWGIQHTGTARELFNNYRFHCSPVLEDREVEQIWKSAFASNPTATLTDDAILNCVKAWRRKQSTLVAKTDSVQKFIVTGDTSLLSLPPVTSGKPSNNEIQSIVTGVTGILGLSLNDIEESYKLDGLHTRSGISQKLFDKIVARERVRLDEVFPEDEMRLKTLIDWGNTKIDWDAILPAPLARDLNHDARCSKV